MAKIKVWILGLAVVASLLGSTPGMAAGRKPRPSCSCRMTGIRAPRVPRSVFNVRKFRARRR